LRGSKNIFLAVYIGFEALSLVSVAYNFFSVQIISKISYGTRNYANVSAASEQMNVVLEIAETVKLWDPREVEGL
jgi:hypothetical protein